MAELTDPKENKDPFSGDPTQVGILLALLEIKDYLGAILERQDREQFETVVNSHMQGFFVLPAPWAVQEKNDE